MNAAYKVAYLLLPLAIVAGVGWVLIHAFAGIHGAITITGSGS